MAKAIATETTVAEAAEALIALGTEPSMINVQQRVGGSYTTIKRFLALWHEHRATTAAINVPADLTELGEEWLRRLWTMAAELAQREGQAVRDHAREETEQARKELAEATSELQRLEQVETELTGALEAAKIAAHALELRNAALEAQAQRVETLDREVEALRREAAAAGDLRTMLGELQAQVMALSASRKKS